MRRLEPTFRLHLADDDEPQESTLRPVPFSQLVGDALADHVRQLRDRRRPQQPPAELAPQRVRCRDMAVIVAHGRKRGQQARADARRRRGEK